MFDMYDDNEAFYKLKYSSNGVIDYLTTQALYEFFMLEEHKLLCTFSELLKQLDRGDIVYAEQWTFNWHSSTNDYEGAIVITRPDATKVAAVPSVIGGCLHKDKYVNNAGGTKFWYCRSCKKDLGDA